MSHVAWLGTGLLGAGFVAALRSRNVPVRVWNRSREKAEALARLGAEVADTPAHAVQGASRIHLTLSDDAAVDAVLEAAAPELAGPIFDHTTTSVTGAARRFAAFAGARSPYLHAPVFMGPGNARAASGTMLISGPKDAIDAAKPWLEPMCGRLLNVGEAPDRAAVWKLCGNGFILALNASLVDAFSIAKNAGAPAEDVVSLFREVGIPVAEARAKRMTQGGFENASFELSMARKDVRLAIEAAGDEALFVLPGVAALMDMHIGRGEGGLDHSVVGSDAVKRH